MTHRIAIWIDHNEARAIALADDLGHASIAHLHAHDQQTHPKHGDGHRHPADPRFLAAVTDVIAKADEVALLGPAGAKEELVAHLESAQPLLRPRVVAIGTMDRVTEGELATHARELLARSDRMHGVPVVPPRR